MMTAPLDDAIRSAQKLILLCLALYVVFIAAYPGIVNALQERTAISHLYAWLQLRDFSNTLPKQSNVKIDITKNCKLPTYSAEHDSRCPFEFIEYEDSTMPERRVTLKLAIDSIWPKISNDAVHLQNWRSMRRLLDGTKADPYDITVDNYRVPYSKYALMRLEKDGQVRFAIVPQSDVFRFSFDGEPKWRQELERPDLWERLRLMLARSGLPLEPSKLSLNDRDLLRFIFSSNTASTISIFGVSFPLLLALSLFQIIFALVTVWAMGPLRALRGAPDLSGITRTWIVITETRGDRRTELSLRLVSYAFAFSPVIPLCLQVDSGVFWEFEQPVSFVLLSCNLLCCFISLCVLWDLGQQLERCRVSGDSVKNPSHLAADEDQEDDDLPSLSSEPTDNVIRITPAGVEPPKSERS